MATLIVLSSLLFIMFIVSMVLKQSTQDQLDKAIERINELEVECSKFKAQTFELRKTIDNILKDPSPPPPHPPDILRGYR